MIARRHRHAGRRHGGLGGALRAHRADRLRRRPDEDQAGVDAALREIGVLRQKAVSRMHRVRAHAARELDDALAVEIALRRPARGRDSRPRPLRARALRRGRHRNKRRSWSSPGAAPCARCGRRSRRGWRPADASRCLRSWVARRLTFGKCRTASRRSSARCSARARARARDGCRADRSRRRPRAAPRRNRDDPAARTARGSAP